MIDTELMSSEEFKAFRGAAVIEPGAVSEETAEALRQLPTASDLIEAHREARVVQKALDAAIGAALRTGGDRDSLEGPYTMKLDLLYYLARSFHPWTSYGRDCLKQAAALREEFESICGPLVTRVELSNLKIFRAVLSRDLLEDVANGRSHAIGALRGGEEGLSAAGALAYDLDRHPLDGSIVLRVKWLYVDEDFRGRGIGNALIGELMTQTAELTGVSGMTVDIPALMEDAERLSWLFDGWRFSFATGVSPEMRLCLGDIPGTEQVEKAGAKAEPLSGAGAEQAVLLKRFFARTGHTGYLASDSLPQGYIDSSLSCYIGDPLQPEGVLLAHRCPSGKLRVEACECWMDQDKNAEALICHFIAAARAGYAPDTLVELELPSEEVGEAMDRLFPQQRGELLMEGILKRPDPARGEDLTSEDVDGLLSLSKEELEQI